MNTAYFFCPFEFFLPSIEKKTISIPSFIYKYNSSAIEFVNLFLRNFISHEVLLKYSYIKLESFIFDIITHTHAYVFFSKEPAMILKKGFMMEFDMEQLSTCNPECEFINMEKSFFNSIPIPSEKADQINVDILSGKLDTLVSVIISSLRSFIQNSIATPTVQDIAFFKSIFNKNYDRIDSSDIEFNILGDAIIPMLQIKFDENSLLSVKPTMKELINGFDLLELLAKNGFVHACKLDLIAGQPIARV